MIEPLNVEIWSTEPAGLDGQAKIGELQQRLICSYFPPHTSFDKDVLAQADERYLKIIPWTGPADMDTSEGPFHAALALNITVANGGAMYLLGEPDEHGTVEARLWKLTSGVEIQ